MRKYLQRLIRAILLQPSLYREVVEEERTLVQAVSTVLLSAAIAGIGGALNGGLLGLFASAALLLIGWFVWAWLCFFIGTTLLPNSQTKTGLGPMLRCTGFAWAPGLFQVFGFIPRCGPVVQPVVMLWTLAAFVVAIRQTLNYTSTARALAVCLLGWLVWTSMTVLFFLAYYGSVWGLSGNG